MSKNTSNESKLLAEILHLATGYQRSKVLFTFSELDISSLLVPKALTAKQLAKKLKINPLAMERFLNACVAVGLLERDGDSFANTEMSEIFLSDKSDFYLGGQLKRYSERSYPVWEDLTEHLKKWEYGNSEEDTPEDDDQGAEAMEEQHNLALLHGFTLAKSFDFSKYKKILDLGGGTGAMSIGLCKSYPELQAVVFDLPENVKTARKYVKKSKLEKRIECIGGDFKEDELPEDFDVVLLANFMAVAEEEENKKLLQKIYDQLPSGGACLLSGWIMDDSRLAPETSVLFCLEDICWDAPDVERTQRVYTEWLKEAGFENIKCEMYLEPTKMLYGFKK